MVLSGPVASTTSAVAGGLVTGTVLGVVQAWALRANGRHRVAWAVATALGLAIGITTGTWIVGFSTNLGDLVVQGAVSGAATGMAQAVVLLPRIGPVAFAWPVFLAGAWAVGWTVTTVIGVQVDEQFTVFGSAGALVVALLTSVLPLVLNVRSRTTGRAS